MVKKINTERGNFSYRIFGKTTCPVLMLVHGWPQSSYCWIEVSKYLTDYFVIAPDLRGLGDSERNDEVDKFTKDQLALDLFAIADTLGLEEFYLGGHDWGGAVVQEMALLQPQRIKKLIILNMMLIHNAEGKKKAAQTLGKQMFRSSWYQFFQSIPGFAEKMIEGKEDIWIRFFCRGISSPIPEEAIQEYIRCYKIDGTITSGANLYRSLPTDRLRWKTYHKKTLLIPSLIIHGELDPVIIKDFLFKADSVFSNLKIKYLKAGHFIGDEQPKKVGNAINTFLKEER